MNSTRPVEDFALLLQKAPMSFASMTGPEYFGLPAVLPQACDKDDLNGEECSDEKYALLKKVVERFNIKTQREWLRLYLYSDVLLLVDCFEANRNIWQEENGLDIVQSVTGPFGSIPGTVEEDWSEANADQRVQRWAGVSGRTHRRDDWWRLCSLPALRYGKQPHASARKM